MWTADALRTLDANSFYNAFSRTGITYGPQFRGVENVTIDADPVAHMRYAPDSLACGSHSAAVRLAPSGRHISTSAVNICLSTNQSSKLSCKVRSIARLSSMLECKPILSSKFSALPHTVNHSCYRVQLDCCFKDVCAVHAAVSALKILFKR